MPQFRMTLLENYTPQTNDQPLDLFNFPANSEALGSEALFQGSHISISKIVLPSCHMPSVNFGPFYLHSKYIIESSIQRICNEMLYIYIYICMYI